MGAEKTDTNAEFLTARQAAQFLQVGLPAIYNLCYKRRLQFFKPNSKNIYFRRDDLVAYVEKGRVPVGPR